MRTPKPAPKLVPPPVRPKPVEAPVPVEEEELEVSGMEWEPGWDATMAWKTRLCKFFELGTCQKGDACSFAHGPAELQGPPSVSISAGGTIWADMVKEEPDSEPSMPTVSVQEAAFKTALCRHHQRGVCFRGSACLFAHGEEELRDNRKTVLCKFYDQGTCQHGDQCLYAHGVEELQTLDQPELAEKHPGSFAWHQGPMEHGVHSGDAQGSFKTALCKFFEIGQCLKGEACTFAHGPDELANSPDQGKVTAATPKAAMTGAAAVAAAQPKAAPKAAVVVPPPSRAKALEEATEPLEEANADVADRKSVV